MKSDAEAWIKRADELLSKSGTIQPAKVAELIQFATSMLTALYGRDSPQLHTFRNDVQTAAKGTTLGHNPLFNAYGFCRGTIENAKAELQAGLIGNVRVYVAGEVLAEMLRLGKEILDARTEAATNVGSVLIAAAYEGVLRKMAEQLTGITERRKLEDVISALKSAEVLKGGQVNTANSYLKFRNDSLHADWGKVDRSQVDGCLLFVESLLEKYFS